jgi:hypothetical protein
VRGSENSSRVATEIRERSRQSAGRFVARGDECAAVSCASTLGCEDECLDAEVQSHPVVTWAGECLCSNSCIIPRAVCAVLFGLRVFVVVPRNSEASLEVREVLWLVKLQPHPARLVRRYCQDTVCLRRCSPGFVAAPHLFGRNADGPSSRGTETTAPIGDRTGMNDTAAVAAYAPLVTEHRNFLVVSELPD